MKRYLCALAAILLLAGCGGKTEEPVPILEIGGTTLDASSSSVEEALTALGDGYTYAEAVSCVYDGMDKTYTYPDAVVYTYPDGGTDRLMELYCTGGDVKTPQALLWVTLGKR